MSLPDDIFDLRAFLSGPSKPARRMAKHLASFERISKRLNETEHAANILKVENDTLRRAIEVVGKPLDSKLFSLLAGECRPALTDLCLVQRGKHLFVGEPVEPPLSLPEDYVQTVEDVVQGMCWKVGDLYKRMYVLDRWFVLRKEIDPE